MVWAPSNILIFQVENEIIDFGSDLLSSEEYSLNKLDNVVFSLQREKCFENKQFSLSGQISIHVSSLARSRSKYLNKIIQHSVPTAITSWRFCSDKVVRRCSKQGAEIMKTVQSIIDYLMVDFKHAQI